MRLKGDKVAVSSPKIAGEAINSGRNLTVVALTTKNRRGCTVDQRFPKRFPSHDFGMVGFVKSLVDLTHESAIKNRQEDESKFSSRVSVLEFGEGICMLLKS